MKLRSTENSDEAVGIADTQDEDIQQYKLRLLQIQHTEQIRALEADCAAELQHHTISDELDQAMSEMHTLVDDEWTTCIHAIDKHTRHSAYLSLLYKMTLRWLQLYRNQLQELITDHCDQPDARIAVNDAVIRMASKEYALRHHAKNVGIPVEYYRQQYM